MPVDAESFKQALASWVSGVTIITSRHADHVHGMTVSAFSSVSLSPPLVMVCLDKVSNTLKLVEAAKVFSVNVLAQGQEELSQRFASKEHEDVRFEGLNCEQGTNGCPHIPGAVSTMDCRVLDALDAGDHVIYIGEVHAAKFTDRPPLVYLRAAYRTLT
ncbi:MAG: flavin reductase family protein [Myxococcales bacterium]|nr:flavin reductase family protein [Myxococcales bacterium]TDJ04499.1 MAG: flavin reductase [Deltaproteobacteria bacterium]